MAWRRVRPIGALNASAPPPPCRHTCAVRAEEPRQTLLGDARQQAIRVTSGAGDGGCRLVDVGCENLHLRPRARLLAVLAQNERKRIRLFPCTTARHPDPDRVLRPLLF